jgi:site-specific DNA-methyltransferase (adenine-specific)
MGSSFATENEAPFPEYLAEVIVRSFCPPGGTVLDCFAGSGTTLVACQREGFGCVGVEMEQAHCEIARRRLMQDNFAT